MPVISTTKMTARQFEMLGEDPPGVRLELVDGEIAVSPSPRPRHSHTLIALIRILGDHIDRQNLGELLTDVDTVFGEFDVRRPDLLFFTRARAHLIGPDKAIEGIPDLCIEIISPSSVEIDRDDKFKQYAAGGVPCYWIIDPKQGSAEAFELGSGKYSLVANGSDHATVNFPPFADIAISLSRLWRPKN